MNLSHYYGLPTEIQDKGVKRLIAWKTLSSSYVFKTPFGNLRRDICELPDGQVIEDYYVNEYTDWVNAIVLTKEHEIILVSQYRYAGQNFFLEIPAGKPEGHESYQEAILREVQEETGYTTDQEPILLGQFYVNPATQTNKVYTYLILDAFHISDQQLDPTEFVDVHMFDFKEMHSLIANGDIQQLFTANAYYMALAFLKEKGIQ